MSLISQRPKSWNAVVGQERALRVLKSVLATAKFLPRGFIFEGVFGVGKTTTAYLFTRALLCTGKDPLGCGTCPSCSAIDAAEAIQEGINSHPDFTEVAAAFNSGVADARNIVVQLEALPVLGQRRVFMIDEAHRQSREAWDVYLAPLERRNSSGTVIFVTNDADKIPFTIQSRCCKVRFGRLAPEQLLGLLVNTANNNEIAYEHDGLRLIARCAKGHARDAMQLLDTVAAMGKVTKELVADVVDNSVEDACIKVLLAAINKDAVAGARALDETCRAHHPAHVIDTLFSLYGKIVFAGEDPVNPEEQRAYDQVRSGFPDVAAMSQLLIKWATTPNIPADAMPIFVVELIQVREPVASRNATPVLSQFIAAATPRPKPEDEEATVVQAAECLGAEVTNS